MRVAAARALVEEVRTLGTTLREETATDAVGPVVISGVLAAQLAKELGAGAAEGAVMVGDGVSTSNAEVLVHVVAGDPTDADEELARVADERGIGIVIVELWPQADWTRPFVLSPFVVECRAGEGFPVREIAERTAEATGGNPVLSSRIPVLADAVRARVVRQAVIRSAVIAVSGSRLGVSRPLLSLEQVRMVSRLRTISLGQAVSEELPALAGSSAAVLASGFAFRRLARSLRTFLPAPVANAAVAAAATWALSKALQAFESRLPSA